MINISNFAIVNYLIDRKFMKNYIFNCVNINENNFDQKKICYFDKVSKNYIN